jgi:carbon monoxide dehydrogenase subunit G
VWGLGYARRADTSAFFVASELEIVDYEPPFRLVSRSQGTVRSQTTWALSTIPEGTLVTFAGEYNLPLGLRLLGDRAVEQMVSAQVRQSLRNLKRLCETPPPSAS